VTTDQLTAILAERVMGWKVAPDRFLTGNRTWMPRWRFDPTRNFDDAFRLLDEVRPESYTMGSDGTGGFRVRVQIAGTAGEACDASRPLAISLALARALGIGPEVES
jgi:hypothetical protein